jgi:hypothetical protein
LEDFSVNADCELYRRPSKNIAAGGLEGLRPSKNIFAAVGHECGRLRPKGIKEIP